MNEREKKILLDHFGVTVEPQITDTIKALRAAFKHAKECNWSCETCKNLLKDNE